MRRLLPALLPLVLAACDGGAAPPPVPAAQLRASFPVGGVIDTIVIDTVERLPLRAAALVAPDGNATQAGYINIRPAPQFAAGQWVASDPWLNALNAGGVAAAPVTAHPASSAAVQGRAQLLATVSTADIALPDPVAYRRDWARYRIRLTFGTPPDTETREIAAPEPLPQPPPPPS